MKCPYHTITIHKPAYTEDFIKHHAEDVVEFGECYMSRCPYYYTTWSHGEHEHCRKAESECK